MREIKFRAIDRHSGKWAYGLPASDTETVDYSEIPSLFVGATENEDCYLSEIIPGTLCQYTGLKDNNGKEIYEGDIVRTALGYTQKVIWSDMYAAFVAVYKDKDRLNRSSMPYRVDCTDEIIGNIHENPELLGVKI